MTHVDSRRPRPEKETIHSGHFMVSHFEAEAQDDFDDLAVPVPEEEQNSQKLAVVAAYSPSGAITQFVTPDKNEIIQQQQLSIETSLTKLFKCMTLAYRQKLTSPKWNRFKGIKLRWKDKIRLNNVIWRCWHMQFIKKQNTLVCQFASPLDVDTHVKPETTILEGKYWKRRAEAVKAEYKKWRMFHITRLLGKGDSVRDMISDMDAVETFSQCGDMAGNMLMDEDYITFMSDTLFSTITSHQPFAFPDTREIARGASLADFIQPSLGPLQPNLDDFMDTLDPFHELLSAARLPPVPEETAMSTEDQMYRSGMVVDSYGSSGYMSGSHNTSTAVTNNQVSIQASRSNSHLMRAAPEPTQAIKNERAQLYDNSGVYAQADCSQMQGSILVSQQHPTANYQNPTYQQCMRQQESQVQENVYSSKPTRPQYSAAQKILTHSEGSYSKPYSTGAPTPSQTAPETVSLLQQPLPSQKLAVTTVLQGRPGYSRDKPSRPRITQYTSQLPSNHYQPYTQPMQHQISQQTSIGFDGRTLASQRQASTQMQYMQPNQAESFNKNKSGSSMNSRSFKMPSPPLAAIAPQHQQVSGSSSRQQPLPVSKESFRSTSLPVGAQLNADWTITAPPVDSPPRINARQPRECASIEAMRIRARSSSSGALVPEGAGGTRPSGRRIPPPLASVASEPALPQASVMLAQLLTAQHSQSLYKLSSNEDVAGHSDPTKSPLMKGQPSPIGSDIMSPLQDVSPSTSPPQSPGSPREPRRSTHLHAEQKRRYNIKNGFDTLQALIPHLNNNPAAKVSKAAMLQKGAEYIKQLKAERNQIKEEMESLKQQIDCLNNSISNCHSLLPATGAPVSRARAGRLREMFARHVAGRTLQNWKYWVFSVVAAALVESFSSCVACSSSADLVRTTLLWAEQHCSLAEMRPAVLSSLRMLGTTTDILTNPERLPDEARAAATRNASIKTEPT